MIDPRRALCIALAMGLLSTQAGCSWVKSWFPDKEKEYKYSTEIPPLDVPPDLSATTIEDPTLEPAATAGRTPAPAGTPPDTGAAAGDKAPTEAEPAVKLVKAAGTGVLEISQPFPEAWRLVEKALTRKAIEVTDRDRSRGLYYVLYHESDEAAAEEGSLWGEFLFFLGKESKRETEYRVLLEDADGATRVSIVDKEGTRVTEGAGLRLLNLIKEALESDT